MNVCAGGSASTGSTPPTLPQSSSDDVDEAYEIEEIEVEDDNDKEKGSDTVDYSNSGLPLTFCMKRNIVLDVPSDVVQAIADFRPPRKFRRGIPRKPSFLHQWGVYVVGDDDNTACVPLWYCMIKGCREAKFVVKCTKENTSNCNKHLKEKHSIRGGRSVAYTSNMQKVSDGVAAVRSKNKLFPGQMTRWAVLFLQTILFRFVSF